jgi:hypothetical protein
MKPGSGKVLVRFFDQTCRPSTVTSKAPPDDGISRRSLICRPYSFSSSAARPTALSV